MTDFIFASLNSFTKPLVDKLRLHPKRIVFTEGEDLRVLRVAQYFVQLEIGVPILLGNVERIGVLARQEGIDMTFIRVVDPSKAGDLDGFVKRYEKIERYRDRQIVNAREVVSRPLMYGGLMVQYGHADALVGGNQFDSGLFYRAMFRTIKKRPEITSVFTVMAALGHEGLQNFGREGFLLMSDCKLVVDPTPEELADIAVETGQLAAHYLGRSPRVVLLSHSTLGSHSNKSSKKVVAALSLARQKSEAATLNLEGELQADVALDPEAAEIKLKKGVEEAEVDVLVFPQLDAAHISMKLLKHVAQVRCYGHLVLGLARPVAQVPVTADEEMIFGTACAVGIEAIKFHELYPQGRGLRWS